MLSGVGEKTTEVHITLVFLHKTKKTRSVMAVCLLINGLPFPGAEDLGNMKPLKDHLSRVIPLLTCMYNVDGAESYCSIH